MIFFFQNPGSYPVTLIKSLLNVVSCLQVPSSQLLYALNGKFVALGHVEEQEVSWCVPVMAIQYIMYFVCVCVCVCVFVFVFVCV